MIVDSLGEPSETSTLLLVLKLKVVPLAVLRMACCGTRRHCTQPKKEFVSLVLVHVLALNKGNFCGENMQKNQDALRAQSGTLNTMFFQFTGR